MPDVRLAIFVELFAETPAISQQFCFLRRTLANKNEVSATAKLNIARRFLEESGNKDLARKKAQEVIEQFPETKAAQETGEVTCSASLARHASPS